MSIPFIFNELPNDLIQVSMSGSVGAGGRNDLADVKLIQTLLNAVPITVGGPSVKLAVDGNAGVKTIAAIKGFQTKHRGLADGRFDVGGKALRTLIPLLRSTGALPRQTQGLSAPSPQIAAALVTSPSQTIRSNRAAVNSSGIDTIWSLVSSGGFAISVSFAGIAGGDLLIKADSEKTISRLRFGGVAAGMSVMPVGFDFGDEHMPSTSKNRIFSTEPRKYWAAESFVGPCVIFSGKAQVGPGVAASHVLFRGAGSVAYGAIVGMQVGIPDVGWSVMVGTILSVS